MTPGSDVFDWYAINDALRNAGMDGWQIGGTNHTPTAANTYVPNPSYDKSESAQWNRDAGNGEEFIVKPGGDYIISVVNPQTNQMVKLHLSKSAADAQGNYTYGILGREDQGKLDKTQAGYTGIQRLPFADGHEELWGTNSATGAFEKMPNAPPDLGNLKGWNDIRQIETTDANGNRVMQWVGTDPKTGNPLTPIPGAPTINSAKYVPGSVKQVTKNGRQVYMGQNPQTGAWEEIPELGSEPVSPKTTTVGGQIYKDNPNAGKPGEPDFVKVSGIATPNEGDRQWADAGQGYVKRQEYHNGVWSDVGPDDPEGTWRPVNPATVRAEGAIKPAGTKYWIPLSGSSDQMIEVTADGNGGYTYETGPSGEPPRTMRIPGITQPTTVTGAGTEEFLPPRRDANGNLLPPEKNPNWQPASVTDRVRQLQEQATAKQQELHQQVLSGALSEDQANTQFHTWWDSTITPAKQEIDQAAQQKQIEQQLKLTQEQRQASEQQRANYATAVQAGQNAIEAAKAQLPYMVGPGFAGAMNNIQQAYAAGTAPGKFDIGSAVTFQMPDLNALAQQATNQALAHISPMAAAGMNAATGPNVPNFNPSLGQQPPNYTQGLNLSQYQIGGAPPPVSAPPQPQPPAPAPAPSFAPVAYTPPGGSSYGYPTVPWAGATPQPLAPAFAPYQLTAQ